MRELAVRFGRIAFALVVVGLASSRAIGSPPADAWCLAQGYGLGSTIQAALDRPTGPIDLPQGTFCLTESLTLSHRSSLLIRGAGAGISDPKVGTTLLWRGPADAPAVRLLNSRELHFQDFTVEASTALHAGFESITDHRAQGYSVPAYGISWERVVVGTRFTAPLTYGFLFRKGTPGKPSEYPLQARYVDRATGAPSVAAQDWNNSEMTWRDSNVVGAKFGIYADPANSQAKAFRIYNGNIACDGSPESAGIGGRPDGTPATSGVSSIAMWGGNINKCGFAVDVGGPNDYLLLENVNSELCGAFLRTTYGWYPGSATLSNNRIGLSGSALFPDGSNFIDFGWQGGLVVIGNLFDAGFAKTGYLTMNTSPAGSGAVVYGNSFRFSNVVPWRFVGGYKGHLRAWMNWLGGSAPHGTFAPESVLP